MSGYYFISYSRQEITFVDSLSQELNKRGYETWIDFQKLVPGRPWDDQLGEAIKGASAVLLVVSKASMASDAVHRERQSAILDTERVILLIFEACPLPEELVNREWVDFRLPFPESMRQLEVLLKNTPQLITQDSAKKTAPQRGFRMPPAPAWLFTFAAIGALFSVLMFAVPPLLFYVFATGSAHLSVPSVATAAVIALAAMFIPWTLLRLPWKIRQRNYRYRSVQNSLLIISGPYICVGILWFAATIDLLIIHPEPDLQGPFVFAVMGFLGVAALIAFFSPLIAFFMLRYLPGLYRWAGPGGARVHSRSHWPDPLPPMRSINVAIEHATEDSLFATELLNTLQKAGHHCSTVNYDTNPSTIVAPTEPPPDPSPELSNAEVVLSIVSRFKTASQTYPESQMVIPVLVETCKIDTKLSRLQWLDLRAGYSQDYAQKLARLLVEPSVLLDTLGALPTRLAVSYPPQISNIIVLLSYLVFSNLITLIYIVFNTLGEIKTQVHPSNYIVFIVSAGGLAASLWLIRGIRMRVIPYKRVIISSIVLVTLTLIVAFTAMFTSFRNTGETETGGPILLCLYGLFHFYLLLWLPILLTRHNLRLWLPEG
ncbi:MAG: toll/interleukin-1 receptor domain-containing protein [Chloroflexota bacterium]